MLSPFDSFVQIYGSVIIAVITLIVTVLYTTLTRRLIKTEERNLEAQNRMIEEQRAMFAMERTPYIIFEHKSFNAGFLKEDGVYKYRIDTYFKNVSRVRAFYHFEDFRLSSDSRLIGEMDKERQKRLRYILPDQERHHFNIIVDDKFVEDMGKWHYFEYTLVYESCEDVHTVRYKSRRKIRFKPESYESAEAMYLHWSVPSEYDGPYNGDTFEDN